MCGLLKKCKDRVTQLTRDLKEAEHELNELEFQAMPDLMHELGVEAIKLDEGTLLSLGMFYKASIPKDPSLREKAFKWLRANGHEGMIKREIIETFSAGADRVASQLVKQLEKLGIPFMDRESVHHATLTAFVREQHQKGNPHLPLDAFGAYIGERVVMKER